MLTEREREFLASLSTSWRGLYRRELALLLQMDGADCPYRRFGIRNGHDANAQVKVRDKVKIEVD